MSRRSTGDLGERLAADFLRQRGFDIMETNFHCREGEIDIVARDGDVQVFVEVKTRRSRQFGSPEESMTGAKKERIRRAAARYREAHDGSPEAWRIDFVAVELDRSGRPARIELIENAVGEE